MSRNPVRVSSGDRSRVSAGVDGAGVQGVAALFVRIQKRHLAVQWGRRLLAVTVAVLGGILFASCDSGTEQSRPPATASAAECLVSIQRSQLGLEPVSRVEYERRCGPLPADVVLTPTSTPSLPPESATPVPAPAPAEEGFDPIAGLGATKAAWNASHPKCRGAWGQLLSTGSCEYTSVTFGDGSGQRVVAVDLNLESGTTIEKAEALTLSLFPADARADELVRLDDFGGCLGQKIRSATLSAALPGLTAQALYADGAQDFVGIRLLPEAEPLGC